MDTAKSRNGGVMGDTNGGDYFAVNVGDMKQREPAEPGPVSTLRVDATGSEEAETPNTLVNNSDVDVRPPLPKAGTEAPKARKRASFARFATATQAPMRRLNTQHRQAAREEVEIPSSDSSDSEEEVEREFGQTRPLPRGLQTARHPIQRLQSTRQQKAEEKKDNKYSRFRLGNDYFSTTGKVRKRDGRLNISVNEKDTSGYLAKALGTGFRHHFFNSGDDEVEEQIEKGAAADQTEEEQREQFEVPDDLDDFKNIPRLNIVIIVIGSRGDIQPFLRVGRILHDDYGHRVRIATHPAFKDFVEKEGALEFFSVGGDPSELMAFMVKNPGLIPSIDTIRAGEIGARRAQMSEMFEGMWRACINATDEETNKANSKMMGVADPFVADAIIANPPSFAHIHIAERLGIPLHLMFTFPYTPSTAFPHPLANIKSTNVDRAYANFMSYPLVELMTWQGLGDLINKFRTKTLGLEEVSTLWAPGQIYRMKVPITYMWSPGLVPKPRDYGSNIDIVGFVFLELGSSFDPPEDLQKFLDAGEPPVYIGFGSIVVDDPNAFTEMIFEAVKLAGVRALVSKGWGGLGGGEMEIPDNIFLLDNTPHDWLFPRVSAVVHHGGAGTSAMGLKCGKPTMIVPFFGDQPFWGAMVAKQRAGAFECIPYKALDAEKLAEGIKQCLTDEARENVKKIADKIGAEGDGAHNAVKAFHKHLMLSGPHSICCSVLENRVAVWKVKVLGLRLSALAASMLVKDNKLRWHDLRLARLLDWNDFQGAGGPLTGFAGPILSTLMDTTTGMVSIPYKGVQAIKQRKKHNDKKKRHEARRKKLEEVNGTPLEPKSNVNGPTQSAQKPELNRLTSTMSADPTEPLVEELAKQTGHGFAKAGKSVFTLPGNLMVGITQGFHNAPRLYGDETVRRPHRVSGIKSGLRAGRDEFMYGVWDGWTGVVTQPYHGAKDHGVVGGIEGTAIGLGGFVLKNIAAVFGPLAYTLKGIEKETQKSKQPTKLIRKGRVIQGDKERFALESAAAREAIQQKPADHDTYLEKEKSQADNRLGKEKEGDDIFLPAAGETLELTKKTLDAAWEIVLELLEDVKEKKNEGPLKITGRLGFFVHEKKWHDSGAMENVHSAKAALDAKREGRDIEEAVEEWRQKQRATRTADHKREPSSDLFPVPQDLKPKIVT